MDPKDFQSSQEAKVTKLAGELWNEFLKVEGINPQEIHTVMENIHRIQDMMLANLFTKIHGKF